MKAEERLRDLIEAGKKRLPRTLQVIQDEILNREDYIVRPHVVDIEYDGGGFKLRTPEFEGRLTGWAKTQLFQRAEIPIRFANKLIDYELHDTLYMLFKALLPKTSPDGLLIRKVRDTIKGVLSTKYKRFDSALFLESFVTTCMDNAYMPYDAVVSDTSYYLKFIYPRIVEVDDDPIIFMLSMQTSDYGANALKLEAGVLRLMCVNGIIGFNLLRHIHIGRRFRIDEELEVTKLLSDETLELDTKAVASAVRDIVSKSIGAFDYLIEIVSDACDKHIPDEEAAKLLKKFREDGKITKELYEAILNVYKAPMPVEVLPEKKSAWRLSNAIAYVAQKAESLSDDDRIELERLAYEVL